MQQMQVQRVHAGRSWSANNGGRFLKPVPILPSGMPCLPRITAGKGAAAAGGGGGGGEGTSKIEIGPVRRPVTSDRSFNLNRIPYTGSTLHHIHLNLQQEQDDKLTDEIESKEFDSDSDSAASTAAVPALTTNSKSNSTSTSTSTSKSIALALMFASWNIFNIYFNIFNKQVLKVYPFPMTVNAMQFGVGSVMILIMWGMKLHKRPKISSLSQLWVIGALAAVHTMGNVFTNMSLLKVAVSFTHTVKAMEPFFSVLLSALFLHQQPSGMAIATLIPIVGGVALASFTEASFNWIGFWSAMASNLANQSRNVVSKTLMTKDEESLDNINLFSLITIISFFISAPLMLLTEGITFTPSYLLASGLNVREIYVRSLLAGVCFHAYQQAGYMLLEHISPVSHSVGNCVKRVVVIVASVLFFRTPISPINSLGTGIALAGVFLYSRVNSIKKKSM